MIPLLLCARQELLLAVRSRWTQIFAAVFAALALAVASSGYVLTDGYGVQDFVRTGALLAAEGTAAFGAASLAFLRFTRGPLGAGLLLTASLLLWMTVPPFLAVRRLGKSDL